MERLSVAVVTLAVLGTQLLAPASGLGAVPQGPGEDAFGQTAKTPQAETGSLEALWQTPFGSTGGLHTAGGLLADAGIAPPSWMAGALGGETTGDAASTEPIHRSTALTARLAGVGDEGISSALERAKLGTEHQAIVLGLGEQTPVTPERFEHPSRSVQALVASHGGSLAPAEEDRLQTLDALPTEQARALARVVDAYRAFEQATEQARAQGAFAAGGIEEASPTDPLEHDAPGLGSVLATRTQFLDAVEKLHVATAQKDAKASAQDVDRCPTIAIDADGSNDTYTEDCSLVIDLGGSDTYHNNAGGSDGSAAALVDLEGDDRYGDPALLGSRGVNGGAVAGAGVLVDASGDDVYAAQTRGINGGASLNGAGLLVDGAGNDAYLAASAVTIETIENRSVASYGVNGGGHAQGLGLLVDEDGRDVYRAAANVECVLRCVPVGSYGVNGGGNDGGFGVLIDASGPDLYQAGTGLTCPGSCEEVASYGVNGGGNFGNGYVFDGAGSDRYEAGVDVRCQDCYLVGSEGVNGGGVTHATTAIANLGTGNDTYQAGVDVACADICSPGKGAVNGGSAAGTSLLFDEGGNDVYQVGVNVSMTCKNTDCDTEIGTHGANGGASSVGRSLLLDGGGDDLYEAGTNVTCAKPACEIAEEAVNGGGDLAAGLLLDLAGTDEYFDALGGTGTDKTVVPKGTAGAQIDTDDPGTGAR